MITAVAPDWCGLLANLRREGTPLRVFYFEHGIAETVQAEIARRYRLWEDLDDPAPDANLRRTLAVHRFLGQELVRIFPPGGRIVAPKREGAWAEEGRGPACTREGVAQFPWPDPDAADLTCMDQFQSLAPEGMRAFHVLDVWEVVRELMGFEQLCFALYEDPELVRTVFDRVGRFAERVVERLCAYPTFGAVYVGDDLGHKTGTLIHPDQIREFVLPWHRRLARLAHRHDKLFLFHSCGDMYALIDDYIDEVRIDAKHSFEDAVLPVTEAKRRYGDRLSLLGGVDVDLLARSAPETIAQHTRKLLATCQPGGGYCLGAGNWVTDYIPVDNYLAMLAAARQWDGERRRT
jgi:uroporphyrinogen decarboxylase